MTYQRPGNLSDQIDALENQTVEPVEINVVHLHNEMTSDFDFENKLHTVYHQDPGVQSKFISALSFNHDTDFISIIDDDIIPGSKWYENCLNQYHDQQGIYGGMGFEIHSDNTYSHKGGHEDENEGRLKVDYVGQSWFFPVFYLHNFFAEPYPFDLGSGTDDIWFSYRMYKERKVRSYVPPHPSDDKEMWACKSFRPVNPNLALCNRYAGHHKDREKLIRHVRNNGFDTVG